MKKSVLVFSAVIATVMFASCASTKVKEDEKKVEEIAVETEMEENRVTVIDWDGRTLGEVSVPSWLKSLNRGNADYFKEEFGINPDRICKLSKASATTEATAQALSRAGFSYACAAELNQKVIGRVGQGLNDLGQLEALYTVASQSKVDMVGLREEATFWQKVRTYDAKKKRPTDSYIFYTVYSMDQNNWDKLIKKYLLDIMGADSMETETQKKIGELFTEMKEEADKKDADKALAEERAYNMQIERLAASKDISKAEIAAEAASRIGADADTWQSVAVANDLLNFLK